MNNNTLYHIWFGLQAGFGADRRRLLSGFNSVKEFYEAESYRLNLSDKRRAKLADKSLDKAREIAEICKSRGYKILTPDDEEYPKILLDIRDAPAVIYLKGNIDFNSSVMFSVVGARKALPYSEDVAVRISYALAKAGFTIVSGGALGIDSAAHRGALEAGGKTVMVLGSGLGSDYLRSNELLREKTVLNGALISEFPPDFHAGRTTFPVRNRLIAALSHGTLVIQAGEKSGSLITAERARGYGRDVFVVPGAVFNSLFEGGNRLIKDGAKPVFTTEDITEEYKNLISENLRLQNAHRYDIKDKGLNEIPRESKIDALGEEIEFNLEQKNEPENLPAGTERVYETMALGPAHVNDICANTGLSLPEVLAKLTELEIFGVVENVTGRIYRQNKR